LLRQEKFVCKVSKLRLTLTFNVRIIEVREVNKCNGRVGCSSVRE